MAPARRADAEYEAEDALTAQVARMKAESAPPPPPAPEPAPTVAKQGGLFAKIMGKRSTPAEGPPDMAPPPPPEMAPPPPPRDATFGAAAQGESAFADASFDAGYPEDEAQDPALADPALVAAAFGEAPPKAKSKAKSKSSGKSMPIVAIGWGVLALLVAIVVGLFALAPGTTVSLLPGAAKVYSLLGMPVGAEGLAFEGVRYGWTSDGSQTVLEVQGNVKNTSGATMTVPTVVIALRDEKGEEISEWTTEVGSAELSAGEEAPFLRQIPSPPSNVRSLKVRFAKAN
jgi:hypothetical protein